MVELKNKVSEKDVLDVWSSSPRVRLISGKEGVKNTGQIMELAKDLGRVRGDMMDIAVWKDGVKVVDNTLKAVAEFGDRPKVLFEPKSARESRRLGAVGHDYSHECYHVQPDSGVNPDAGAEAATKIAAHIVTCFESLGRYVQRLISEGVARI